MKIKVGKYMYVLHTNAQVTCYHVVVVYMLCSCNILVSMGSGCCMEQTHKTLCNWYIFPFFFMSVYPYAWCITISWLFYYPHGMFCKIMNSHQWHVQSHVNTTPNLLNGLPDRNCINVVSLLLILASSLLKTLTQDQIAYYMNSISCTECHCHRAQVQAYFQCSSLLCTNSNFL